MNVRAGIVISGPVSVFKERFLWQKGRRQHFFVRIVDTNHPSGWDNVRDAESGILL